MRRDRRGGRGRMMGKRVLAIGLDPYTIDFDSEFFQGKPLNADIIASRIKADEQRIRGMGHDFEWLLIGGAGRRRRCGGARGTGGAASGGGGDRRRCPVRSGADAGPGGAGEHGDPGRARGAAGVQYFPDHYGGGGWADIEGMSEGGQAPTVSTGQSLLRHGVVIERPVTTASVLCAKRMPYVPSVDLSFPWATRSDLS